MRGSEAIRVLLTGLAAAFALTGALGFVTCGPDVEEDEATQENPGRAAEDEMREDAIRDSER